MDVGRYRVKKKSSGGSEGWRKESRITSLAIFKFFLSPFFVGSLICSPSIY